MTWRKKYAPFKDALVRLWLRSHPADRRRVRIVRMISHWEMVAERNHSLKLYIGSRVSVEESNR